MSTTVTLDVLAKILSGFNPRYPPAAKIVPWTYKLLATLTPPAILTAPVVVLVAVVALVNCVTPVITALGALTVAVFAADKLTVAACNVMLPALPGTLNNAPSFARAVIELPVNV